MYILILWLINCLPISIVLNALLNFEVVALGGGLITQTLRYVKKDYPTDPLAFIAEKFFEILLDDP